MPGMPRARIEVSRLDGDRFQVTVDEGGGRTSYVVTVDPAYSARIASTTTREDLVRRSFDFLLEREPKEAILRSFDLPVIGLYFPEYETEITRRVREG
jgi:hypothetical protein